MLCTRNFPISKGVIGWASEIVSVDDAIRNALRLILGNTLIVETADIAMALRKSNANITCITLRGEVYGSEGIIRGGSISSSEGKRIGRREQIAKQEKALDQLSREIAQLTSDIATAKATNEAIDIKQLTELMRKAEFEKNSFEQGIAQLGYRKEALESARQKQDETLQSLLNELNEFKGSTSTLTEAMDDVNIKRSEADQSKNPFWIVFKKRIMRLSMLKISSGRPRLP